MHYHRPRGTKHVANIYPTRHLHTTVLGQQPDHHACYLSMQLTIAMEDVPILSYPSATNPRTLATFNRSVSLILEPHTLGALQSKFNHLKQGTNLHAVHPGSVENRYDLRKCQACNGNKQRTIACNKNKLQKQMNNTRNQETSILFVL